MRRFLESASRFGLQFLRVGLEIRHKLLAVVNRRRQRIVPSRYMEVAMQSHSKITNLKRAAIAGLLFTAVGCGTDVISYNREFRNQGVAQYNNNDYPDAASSFSNALRQEPGDYTSRYFLGVCEDHMGKLQQAIEQYRTT